MKSLIVMFTVCSLMFVPLIASAQTNPCTMAGVKATADKTSTLPRCINQIYKWSLGIGAILALLMTVVGGYYYMTSGGNAEMAAKGQEYIWGAIIGLVLLFAAYLILNTINPDLVNFKIGNPACVVNGQKTNAPDAAACEAGGGKWDLFYIDNPTPNPNTPPGS